MRKSPENYSLLDRFFVALHGLLYYLILWWILDYCDIVLCELNNNEVLIKFQSPQ